MRCGWLLRKLGRNKIVFAFLRRCAVKRFEYYSALERILSKLEELKRQIEHIETIGL